MCIAQIRQIMLHSEASFDAETDTADVWCFKASELLLQTIFLVKNGNMVGKKSFGYIGSNQA